MTDTAAILRAVAGGKPDESNIAAVVAGLATYGDAAGLTRPERFAHFVAQVAHESGRFRYDEEIWGPTPAQIRYEDRADLGHSPAVDGEAYRFRGRGPIQLTGRNNYRAITAWCRANIGQDSPDFEAEPDAVNTDPWEGLVAIWYWHAGNPTGRSLNVFAGRNDPEAITRKVNGGLNGYQDRLNLYVRSALVLLGFELKRGAVLAFQEAAGFKGRDLDDIPGVRTRAAMHERLKALPALAFGPDRTEPVEIPGDPIAEVRALLAEADKVLVTL